jgi:CrcB protein
VGRVTALLVALGAAFGAPVRYLAGWWLDGRLHWGTLAVNLGGSFVLGILVGAAVDGHWLALLGTGFCGGLTTYSAFAVQSVQGGRRRGSAYVVVSVGGCLALATLGHLLSTRLI